LQWQRARSGAPLPGRDCAGAGWLPTPWTNRAGAAAESGLGSLATTSTGSCGRWLAARWERRRQRAAATRRKERPWVGVELPTPQCPIAALWPATVLPPRLCMAALRPDRPPLTSSLTESEA
jgi:hypothetical protein